MTSRHIIVDAAAAKAWAKKLREDRKLEIVKAYNSNVSLSDVATRFGISRQRVWQIAAAAGCEPRDNRRHARAEQRASIKAEKWEGMKRVQGAAAKRIAVAHDMVGKVPDREIALRLGVNTESVRRYRVRNGIEMTAPRSSTRGEYVKSRPRRAYLLYLTTTLSWHAVGVRLRLSNACANARHYAKSNNKPWPIVKTKVSIENSTSNPPPTPHEDPA